MTRRGTCVLLLVAACSGGKTPEEAAQAYVDAYNRGDAEAVWDMLTDSRRKSIEEGIPSAGAGLRTPRERFVHDLHGRWGADRGTASVAAMKVFPDSLAYATIRIGTAEHRLELWDEDGAFRIGAISWPE